MPFNSELISYFTVVKFLVLSCSIVAFVLIPFAYLILSFFKLTFFSVAGLSSVVKVSVTLPTSDEVLFILS
jgi:hypothetical protein